MYVKVDGGGRRVHTEGYLDSMRAGVLKIEGGGRRVHTCKEIFGQYKGRCTQG